MRLLILGGTAWLGGYLAQAAVAEGHEVSCLARGKAGGVPGGVTFVQADRDQTDAYAAVAATEWDAVIDVSRQPGQVRRAVEALAGRSAYFCFVSSSSAYADNGTPGADEQATLLPALAGDVMESMATYGEAKVACERSVLQEFGPERYMIARVGLIGGPGDWSSRSGYWPLRFARPSTDDGSVLVPHSEGRSQLIDVRDLAAWLIASAAVRRTGTFNVMGDSIPLADHLAVAREVAGHTGPLVRVDQEWLLAHDVQPWMGDRSLPLWLPLPEYAGFAARDTSAARAAGLTLRPLAETLADTLAWELTQPLDENDPFGGRRAGLTDADERALIQVASRS